MEREEKTELKAKITNQILKIRSEITKIDTRRRENLMKQKVDYSKQWKKGQTFDHDEKWQNFLTKKNREMTQITRTRSKRGDITAALT